MPSGDKQVKIKGKPYRWVKGQSGNRNGRPRKDCSLTSLLKVEIEKIPRGEKNKRTWRELLALAWLTAALKNPNGLAFKELLDRTEGRIAQPLAVTGANGGPIKSEQRMELVISGDQLGGAIQALMGCGAITISPN